MINRSDRQRLTESGIISAIGILLSLGVAYIPFLSLLFFFVSTPYIIITARNGIKYGVLSICASSFIIFITTNLIYVLTVLLLFFIPAIFIGARIYKSKNPFDAIAGGFLVSIITITIYIELSSAFLGMNIIQQGINIIKESIEMQKNMVTQYGLSSSLDIKKMVDHIYMIVPGVISIESILMSFFNYYIAVYILRRIKNDAPDLPKLKDFTLPGNIILGIVMIYLLALLVKNIPGIYYDTLTMNIEVVFMFIFFLQGLAVYSHFLEKIKLRQGIKNLFLILSIFIGPISVMVSLIGISDSVLDFRKIRRY